MVVKIMNWIHAQICCDITLVRLNLGHAPQKNDKGNLNSPWTRAFWVSVFLKETCIIA